MKLLGRKLDLCDKCQADEFGRLPEDYASWPKYVSTEAVVAHLRSATRRAHVRRLRWPGYVEQVERAEARAHPDTGNDRDLELALLSIGRQHRAPRSPRGGGREPPGPGTATERASQM